MIEVKKLSHRLGEKIVLNNVDITIPDNTIVGLVGINGAGKSTLLRLLSGVYNADFGQILFDGASPEKATTRQNIFFLPDDPYYTASMTPAKLFSFYKTFYPDMDKAAFEQLIREYNIDVKGKMRNFSKGVRRQVFIALAVAIKPRYLLLDEAFDGLDPLSRKLFKDAIIEFVENERATVIISSHSLRELEDFCDRFILLDDCQVKQHGDIAEHVSNFCKFELAFTDTVDEARFADLPVRAIDIKGGHFVQLVLEGDSEEMRTLLTALSPVVMDEIPLDFEEMFIHDVEKNRGVKNGK